MASLPGLPFKIGMDIYSWAENRIHNTDYPVVKNFGNRSLEFCKNHPFIGGCALLMMISSLGPVAVLFGFLIIANSCLLTGFAVIEFFILAMGLSVFIPVLVTAGIFSVLFTTCLAILHHIFFGGKLRKMKGKESPSRNVDVKKEKHGSSLPHFMEGFDEKMTQTIEWVEKTGQIVEEINGQEEKFLSSIYAVDDYYTEEKIQETVQKEDKVQS